MPLSDTKDVSFTTNNVVSNTTLSLYFICLLGRLMFIHSYLITSYLEITYPLHINVTIWLCEWIENIIRMY